MKTRITNPVLQWAFMVLAALAASACGGGGGGSDTFNPANLDIELYADSKTLPVNTVNAGPSIGGVFTSSITIRAKTQEGSLATGSDLSLSISKGQASGALYYLDGDHEDENGNPLAFKSVTETSTTGVTTFFFHAWDTPGEVVLSATASDPDTGETYNEGITLQVVQGTSTGEPSDIHVVGGQDDPLYVQGRSPSSKQITVLLTDAGNQPVANPDGNNIRVSLQDAPGGGEYLEGGGSSGSTIDIATTNGIAYFTLHSGTAPGRVAVDVTADKDNNLDDGISDAVSDELALFISDGRAYSLTFTGPYAEAILTGRHTFDDGAQAQNGVYSRVLSVVAKDRFGNPVPQGTEVNFGLIDSPITGYPQDGGGSFLFSGTQGNPEEAGTSFTVPAGETFDGARLHDTLVLDGLSSGDANRDHTGDWVIESITSGQYLTVTDSFNANDETGTIVDTGSTVPWYIGRAQYGLILASASTDAEGVATTKLVYPVTRINQTAAIHARAGSEGAAAVLTGDRVYLPVESDGASPWTLTQSHETLPANTTTNVTLCLEDANLNPVPGQTIDYAVENAGSATVTVNNGEPVITGSNGCATFPVTSEGQVAATEADPITLTFGAQLVPTPAVINIGAPGSGVLSGSVQEGPHVTGLECPSGSNRAYTVDMLLTDESGIPIADTVITHEVQLSVGDDGGPSVDAVLYSPANTSSSGITTADGTLQSLVCITLAPSYFEGDPAVSVDPNEGDTVTVSFSTVSGSATFDLKVDF